MQLNIFYTALATLSAFDLVSRKNQGNIRCRLFPEDIYIHPQLIIFIIIYSRAIKERESEHWRNVNVNANHDAVKIAIKTSYWHLIVFYKHSLLLLIELNYCLIKYNTILFACQAKEKKKGL